MILEENTNFGANLYSGRDRFILASGKHVKLETTPDGEELLDAVVPEGKQWEVTVSVSVAEKDAA